MFAPFQKIPWRRVEQHFGQAYQSIVITPGTPNWVRYNPVGQYWEYSIDNVNFFRLPENTLIPTNLYFKNIGSVVPDVPALGEMKMYVRNVAGQPKLFSLWSDGSEVAIASGPSLFPPGAVAFWKLDEANGLNRADAIGANTLINNGVATQIVGKIGNATNMTVAGSQYLSIADNAALSFGVGVSVEICGWVKLSTITGSGRMLISKDDGVVNRSFFIRDDGTGKIQFECSDTGGGAFPGNVTASSFGALVPGTWYFFDIYYDAVGNTIGISINGGSFDTVAFSGGIFDGTAPWILGAGQAGPTNFLDGALDAVGVWKRNLTTAERTQLYNGGVGLEP